MTCCPQRENHQPEVAGDYRPANRNRGASKSRRVEVKDVALPDTMKRAMAKQAEAERERRAKVVNAEGEFQGRRKNGAGPPR